MSINIRHILIILCFVCCRFTVWAQDMQFSNPYANPIYLNPAYTGHTQYWRAGMNYRSQWADLVSPYMAYSLYGDYYFEKYNSGVGFMYVGDRMSLGTIVKNQISVSYMYRAAINDNTYLRMALQPSVYFAHRNPRLLTFPDQIDSEGNIMDNNLSSSFSKPFFDVALGMVFSHKRFYTGIAIHHLTTMDAIHLTDASIVTEQKHTFHIGYNFPVLIYQTSPRYGQRNGHPLVFSPNFIIEQQGTFVYYNIGTYLTLNEFSAGLHYKSGADESRFYVFSAHYTGKKLSLSYHFEFGGLSQTTKAISANTHEIALSIKIGHKKPAQTYFQRLVEVEIIEDMPNI